MLLIRDAATRLIGMPGTSWIRLLAFLPLAIALVAALSYVSSKRSLLWEVPLQSAAIGLLLAGVPVLVVGLFGNWAVFTTPLGFRAAAIALLGVTTASLMRYLQSRYVRGSDA